MSSISDVLLASGLLLRLVGGELLELSSEEWLCVGDGGSVMDESREGASIGNSATCNLGIEKEDTAIHVHI